MQLCPFKQACAICTVSHVPSLNANSRHSCPCHTSLAARRHSHVTTPIWHPALHQRTLPQQSDQNYNESLVIPFFCQVFVHILQSLLRAHHQPHAAMYNDVFCHRLGTSPRPLSPLRNAPPRHMEAHHYLSADPTSDSTDGSRRRAQRAHDQAQQSHVSQASTKQHSSDMLDCIWDLV